MAFNLQEQKALALPSPGSPFELITKTIPTPSPRDILVKVHGIGLNPADWKVQTGEADLVPFGGTFPILVGTDGAGVVVKVGEDVNEFKEGDRVFFQGWFSQDRSSYQEYTLVYADLAAKIPSSMTFLEASSIPLCLATAAMGLTIPYRSGVRECGGAGLAPFWDPKSHNYYRNQPIVILGGASGTGQFTIQIVKYLGFSPIITTASLKNAGYLKSLGATHVVDRFGDVKSAINAILKSHSDLPLSVVLDTVNTPITQKEVDLLSPGGILATIWPLPTNPSLELKENRKAIHIAGSVHLYRNEGRKMYAALTKLLEDGVIKPLRVERIEGGLGAIPKGLERLRKEGGSTIKLVVDPTERE